jgi:hypothetical protein
MFARLSDALGHLFSFSSNGDQSHDEYFASSSDLADLERRMRRIDEQDHAYGMHFCGAISRDQNASGWND